MNPTYTRYYSITIEDATHTHGAFSPAKSHLLQYEEESSAPGRPDLSHVIKWIDSQASMIRDAANLMRSNPGTKTLYLHARLPISRNSIDNPRHEYLADFPVTELVLDELKDAVAAQYAEEGVKEGVRRKCP
jgi:hypothetical protein